MPVITEYLHLAVYWLLQPVAVALMLISILAIWEIGLAFGERFWGLQSLKDTGELKAVEDIAKKRIERADLIARISPMLGLMGTLIPLGPGLAALGKGDIISLSSAVSIAFDTTVLGLFAGILGFILARLRRRWYDLILDQMEEGA
jgi:hypothetical protein